MKVNRLKKFSLIRAITVISLVIVIISMNISNVYSAGSMSSQQQSLVGEAQSESGPAPTPPTPPDTPQTTPQTPPAQESKDITIPVPTSIEGYVYEDLGYVFEGGVVKDDVKRKIPIKDVRVRAGSYETTTDGAGHYIFSQMAPGNYTLEFTYGDITGVSDADSVKNILKYNGYDYYAVKVPGGQEVINVVQEEIKNAAKGVAQVFIALDCSPSMEDAKVTMNGEEKSRLQVEVDAAKSLITSLLTNGRNVYVGLVFFSGTCYRSASLTKNKDLLIRTLDNLIPSLYRPDWRHHTNIVGALDKSVESFYNNDKDSSNRYIVLLSDGAPSSNGAVEVYNGEDFNQSLNKLENTIYPSTAERAKQLEDDGIHLISLFTRTDNEYENDWIKWMFKDNSELFLFVQDGDQVVEAITESIKEKVLSTTLEGSYSSNSFTITGGYENKERRKEVDEYFSNDNFHYEKTILFDQIDNYDPTDDDSKDAAKKLSENSKMDVNGGSGYSIGSIPAENPQYITHIDSETGEVVIDKTITYVPTTITADDLWLARRPASLLKLRTALTGLRVDLANGQRLDTQTRDINDILNGINPIPIIEYIDDELMQGATIQLEYTICIQNDSDIQCNYLELINYLPEGFHYVDYLELINPDVINPDETKRYNSDFNWSIVYLPELEENRLITEESADTYKNRTSVKLTLDNNDQGENGFYIPPGGKYLAKICCSLLVSSFDDLSKIDHFSDVAEVLGYRNNGNHRMLRTGNYYDQAKHIDMTFFQSIFPGDSTDEDFSEDKDSLFILPPTGNEFTIARFYMALVIILLVLLVLCIFFIRRNNEKIANKIKKQKK